MKWLRIVFVATSIILSLLIIYAIINCEISYKYEIENRCGDKIDILWVEEWLKETIKVWKLSIAVNLQKKNAVYHKQTQSLLY